MLLYKQTSNTGLSSNSSDMDHDEGLLNPELSDSETADSDFSSLPHGGGNDFNSCSDKLSEQEELSTNSHEAT